MIEILSWTKELAGQLRQVFGERLWFVGYQGSYGRGEAAENSDIDIVTVLDTVTTADLSRYRETVRTMPQSELACGFICGAAELRAWPRFDLLGLVLDTKPVLGSLQEMTPEFTQADLRQAIAAGSSAIYHGLCHSYLYDKDPRAVLPALCKSAFFCLRLLALERTKVYYASKRELLPALEGQEREILEWSITPEVLAQQNTERVYAQLMEWSRRAMGA